MNWQGFASMTARNGISLYAGVALLSMASLALEVSYIRFFAITRWHHFAFMVVSMALLGYSAAGSLLALRPGLLSWHSPALLWVGSLGFSAATLAGYAGANIISIDPAQAAWDASQFVMILPLYLLVAAPFFFTGLNVAAALSIYPRKAHGIYASDLIGAGAGCALTLLMFSNRGCEAVIGICASLGALSGACFALGWNRKALASAFGIMMGMLILINLHAGFLQPRISPFKDLMVALQYPGARHISTRWNAYSRIDLVESPAARFAPGMSLGFNGFLPPQIGMTTDGDHLNALTLLTGEAGELDFIHWLPASLPYSLKLSGRVLVIEPGGDLDFLMADTYQAASITATIKNPLVIDELEAMPFNKRMRRPLGSLQVIPEDGRAFLRRNPSVRFDLIRLPLSGALTAASSGLYGLQEQYGYTVEAFTHYLSHLSENGILSLSHYLLPPPREELRLWAVAAAALEELGFRDPGQHLAAYRSLTTLEIMVRRSAWTKEELHEIRSFCNQRWFDLVYLPGMRPDETNRFNQLPQPIYADLFRRVLEPDSRSGVFAAYLFDVTPITDDHPFLSYFFRWSTLRQVIHITGGKWQILLEGGYLVPVVALQALLMALVLIGMPLVGRHVDYSGVRWTIPFVVFIGLGFIFMEIGMIHRMTLYFGHPYHAFALTLSVLLISSGIGSRLWGHRLLTETRLGVATIAISIIVLCDGFFTRSFLLELTAGPPPWRFLFAGAFLAATGLILGIPFPSVIRFIHEHGTGAGNVSWAWCLNGGATVVGSALAALTALELGIQIVFILAALCYAAAGVWALANPSRVSRRSGRDSS